MSTEDAFGDSSMFHSLPNIGEEHGCLDLRRGFVEDFGAFAPLLILRLRSFIFFRCSWL